MALLRSYTVGLCLLIATVYRTWAFALKELEVYHELVSSEGMPRMKIAKEIKVFEESLKISNYQITNITFSEEHRNSIFGQGSKIEGKARYNCTCSASYLTRWTSSFPPKWYVEYGHSQRYGHNPLYLDQQNLTFSSTFSLVVPEKTSGYIQCESVQNSSVATRVYIYAMEGDLLSIVRETPSKNQPDIFTDTRKDFVIPCNANYPNVTATLSYGDAKRGAIMKHDKEIIIGDYDPQVGFRIKGQKNASERYVCSAGKQNSFYDAYNPEYYVGKNETYRFYIGNETNELRHEISCKTSYNYESIDIRMINCNSQFECDLLTPCFDILDSCRSNGISVKEGVPLGFPTMKSPHNQGKVTCRSYTNLFNKAHDYLFTGLDYQLYWLSQYEKASNSAIIQITKDTEGVLYTHQIAQFTCQTANFVIAPNIKFAALLENGTTLLLDKINSTKDPAITTDIFYGSSRKEIMVNVTVEMVGIMCLAPLLNSMNWINTSTRFLVKDAQAPVITPSTRLDGRMENRVFYKGDKSRSLFCNAIGEPKPRVLWSIPSKVAAKFPTIGDPTLRFPEIDSSYEGKYNCSATNEHGTDYSIFNVAVEKQSKVAALEAPEISAIVAVIVGLVIAVGVLIKKYMNAKQEPRKLTPEELKEFLYGNPDVLKNSQMTHGATTEDRIQSMGFDPCFEIPSSDLAVDESIVWGEGQFGKVIQGILRGKEVAAKTTKPNADITYFMALLSESKIMAYIAKEKHPNIVEFLGAVVSEIDQNKIYIVVELSDLGNLENYIQKLRPGDYYNMLNSDGTISREKQLPSPDQISTLNFVSWCVQIANGMDFLASKKVIHGDLAARNILMFENDVVKITDFGLSRKLYQNPQYTKKNKADLPMPWMAIESLRFMKFSSQSDVWSFGVTVWEIFSMGEFPYAGIHANDLVKQLLGGYRLERPVYAPAAMYKTLLSCWLSEPYQRPSFSVLGQLFRDFLHSIKNDRDALSTKIPTTAVQYVVSAPVIAKGYVTYGLE